MLGLSTSTFGWPSVRKRSKALFHRWIDWRVLAAAVSIAAVFVSFQATTPRRPDANVEDHFSFEQLGRHEDALLSALHGDAVLSLWTPVTVHGEVWTAHYLRPATAGTVRDVLKPVLLLVHGYGTTSALAWRHVIGPLSKTYQVYALDLPGFGRSTATPTFYSPAVGRDDALEQICAFVSGFQRAVGIRAPYVVAHSFGGFLMTHCVSRSPSLASRLLLADVPGFFSTNGGFDYGWASFFCFGLPHALVRPWGRGGRYLIDAVLSAVGGQVDGTMIDYWHQLQMNPELMSDEVVSKFIVHRWTHAIGTGVALVPLLRTAVPVLLVTGTLDEISPPHQGRLVHELAGVPFRTIPGAGHVPYILHRGKDFVAAVAVGESVARLPPRAARLAACLEAQRARWEGYVCLPSPYLSDRAVTSMYAAVRDIHRACEDAHAAPTYYAAAAAAWGAWWPGSVGSDNASSSSSPSSSLLAPVSWW